MAGIKQTLGQLSGGKLHQGTILMENMGVTFQPRTVYRIAVHKIQACGSKDLPIPGISAFFTCWAVRHHADKIGFHAP